MPPNNLNTSNPESREPGRTIVAAQLTRTWCTQTEAWLYHQVVSLPPSVRNQIVCRKTACLEQFKVPNIHCYEELLAWKRKLFYGVFRCLGKPWLYERNVMKRVRAQIAHSHFGNVGWMNFPAVESAGCKHVVTFYGYDVQNLPTEDPSWKDRYRQMFKSVDLVLSEGPYMRQSIVNLGCPPEKARVQHLGVALEKLPFQPRHWSPGEPFKVLIAGSFVEKKGMPYAIQALGRIASRVDLAITIIGDARKSPEAQAEKQKILSAIEATRLGSRTRLLGYQPYDVLLREGAAHHLFLSPSVVASNGDCEGGAPVTIIEMAATGMPIVSTHHCDIPNVVVDGVTGLLAPERDVDGLAARLNQLIDHPEAWTAMLEGGRKRIVEQFDAKTQGQRLASLYAEVLR